MLDLGDQDVAVPDLGRDAIDQGLGGEDGPREGKGRCRGKAGERLTSRAKVRARCEGAARRCVRSAALSSLTGGQA